MAHDVELEFTDEPVVVIDQVKVGLDGLLHAWIGEALRQPLAVGLVGDLLAELGEVVLGVGVLDVTEELGSFAHQMHASAQQIPGARSSRG